MDEAVGTTFQFSSLPQVPIYKFPANPITTMFSEVDKLHS